MIKNVKEARELADQFCDHSLKERDEMLILATAKALLGHRHAEAYSLSDDTVAWLREPEQGFEVTQSGDVYTISGW